MFSPLTVSTSIDLDFFSIEEWPTPLFWWCSGSLIFLCTSLKPQKIPCSYVLGPDRNKTSHLGDPVLLKEILSLLTYAYTSTTLQSHCLVQSWLVNEINLDIKDFRNSRIIEKKNFCKFITEPTIYLSSCQIRFLVWVPSTMSIYPESSRSILYTICICQNISTWIILEKIIKIGIFSSSKNDCM